MRSLILIILGLCFIQVANADGYNAGYYHSYDNQQAQQPSGYYVHPAGVGGGQRVEETYNTNYNGPRCEYHSVPGAFGSVQIVQTCH